VLEELRERNIATVLLDRVGRDIDFDSVSADNVAASREGTRHLIALGHRRIALVASDPNLGAIRARIQGYRKALHEVDLSQFENVLTIGQNAPEAVKDVLKPLLLKASRPSALFPVTQHMTFGTLKTIGEVGLDLPNDLSLLAFDDCEWFTALRPFLSTIRQPAEDFADQAWSILMALLNNDRSPLLHGEVHCSLVIRESTAPYRGQAVTEAVPMTVT
jgi:LacI family transcriptional regulator